jgi:hypothetical protein
MSKKVIYILLTVFFFTQINSTAQKSILTNASSKTTLIVNIVIIDGTGSEPKNGAIRFKDDAILK